MSARHAAGAALLAALAVPRMAGADITLNGAQHVGDCKPKGVSCAAFTPSDPVSRNSMFNKPINFHLTSLTTLDQVRLDSPVDLGNQLQIYLETPGTPFTSSRFGVLAGDTIDLIPDLVLAPGYYVLLPDGGCTVNNNDGSPNGFYGSCSGGEDNDFSFASITLITAPASTITTSHMFNRRRHIGDSNETAGGDVGYAGRWYPDAAETLTLNLGFTLPENRRLSSVEFYRLRDLASSAQRASVQVGSTEIGTLTQDAAQPASFPIATSLLLLAGPHTLRVNMPDPGDADDVSWDDIILRFSETVATGVPGFFNAVDAGSVNVVSGPLGTKIAGGAAVPDIVALNALGTGLDTSYTGTVEVTLLDATTDSGLLDAFGCDVSWSSTGLSTTLTFAAGDNGRKALPGPFFSRALRKAVLKISDTTTGATGCSVDRFAVRPASFTVSAWHGDEQSAGLVEELDNVGTSGLPRHRAGRFFTLQATAVDAAGVALPSYAGTPENVMPATAVAPALTNGTVSISGAGWSVSGAVRTSDEALYTEVGAVRLEVQDKTFANVDAGDTSDAGRWITGTRQIGRFTPDHFELEPPELDAACGAFSYAGQRILPAGPATLTAVNANNDKTLNYDGVLYKLTTPTHVLAASSYAANQPFDLTLPVDDATLAPTSPGEAALTLDLGAGLAFARTVPPAAAVPFAPFDAEVQVTLGVIADTDGITTVPSPLVLGGTAAGSGLTIQGGKEIRYGRLYLQSRYGSDRLPLELPLRVEYFDGFTFVPNIADGCTSLANGDITAANLDAAAFQTATLDGAGPVGWQVDITAPSGAREVTISLDLSVVGDPGVPYLFLQTDDTDADTNFDDNPQGVATFGLFGGDDRRIYQREVVP